MRSALFSLVIALLAAYAMAVAPLKAVIVSYKSDTPDSVVQDAATEIKKNGGQITHYYDIIKGFAARVPESALEKVQALSTEYQPIIEEDGVVHTNNGDGPQ